jgi:pyrimidine-nucleoside phosphorylase
MVATAEAAGTRTVALLTDMGQPLGRAAGNWIEVAEAVELLRGSRPAQSEDLRELSLILAGWMIHLGSKAATPEIGYDRADAVLADGSALRAFFSMIEAQGGNIAVFDDPAGFHKPGATEVLLAWESGYIAEMDTTKIGWAVQRLGAGRERAGEPVDPHAGIFFHARCGARVEEGQPIATLYATSDALLAEPMALLREAITISKTPPHAVPLVSRVFTLRSAEEHLRLPLGPIAT